VAEIVALANPAAQRHPFATMSNHPTQFAGVTVVTKANVYFDGNVVSHTVLFPGDVKKTLGLIRPGSYHFGTKAAERMEIIAGECRVRLDGGTLTSDYSEGAHFDVQANSGFTIEVRSGLCEYICSFLA
jgi:purine/pyrimidine-nucleoside phosphorylase